MKESEKNLVLLDQAVLLPDGLLHLDDHFSARPHFAKILANFSSGLDIIVVANPAALSSTALDADYMVRSDKGPNACRHKPDPVFTVLHFLWNADDHCPGTFVFICDLRCSACASLPVSFTGACRRPPFFPGLQGRRCSAPPDRQCLRGC